MNISITSEKKEIMDSGTFTTFNEKPSIISIRKKSEGFNITITFKEDKSNSKNSLLVEAKKDEKKNDVNVQIDLINFRNTLPAGFVSPISIGKFDNEDAIHLQLNARKIVYATSIKTKITRDVTLCNDEEFVLSRHKWNMLKRMVKNIRQPSNFISIAYSILFGASITSFLAFFTLPENTSPLIMASFICFTIACLLMGGILLIIGKKIEKTP